MAGKFVIGKRSNGDFQFNLKAGNGQVILTSQGYADKAGCRNGIESVKKNSPDDARYERKTSSNDKPFFNLLAGNGQIIGSSEMYESTAAREKGIESVKANAPDAAVVDETA
ncbi:MAG: YegP family protein [Stenotrophomonas sp.]